MLLAALAASGGAWAQGFKPSQAFFQLGAGSHTDTATAGLAWQWERKFQLESGEISGYWELSLGRWRTRASGPDSGQGSDWVSQLGVTPVFRFRPASGAPWFVEGGIGANLISPRFHSGDKRFSTVFNFGDHIGAGWTFGTHGEHEIALRLQHFSNGGIDHPNPGVNFVQLRYAHRLD